MQKLRRSREGAWIEIYKQNKTDNARAVAPVRERGLKLKVGVSLGGT